MKKLLASLTTFALLALPFSASAVTIIPTGRAYSGDLTISSGTTNDNSTESNITLSTPAGSASTTVSSASGFAAGNYVMLYQTQGTGAGGYEFTKITSISGNRLSLASTTMNAYQSTGAQVIKVSEYHNVTISGTAVWTAPSWNGTVGGVLVAFLTGSLKMTAGTISVPSGFRGGGGFGQGSGQLNAFQGEGSAGTNGQSTGANGNGGGGGQASGCPADASGGGGGNGAGGSSGAINGCGGGGGVVGTGGNSVGAANLQSGNLFLGGGGGGGDCVTAGPCSSGGGGTGAGVVFILSASSTISGGTFSANGNGGGAGSASGGGAGAAGAVRLPARLNLTLGSSIITATGASGGGSNPTGGSSGAGRIATLSAVSVSGTTNPSIDTSSTDYVYDIDNTATPVMIGSNF